MDPFTLHSAPDPLHRCLLENLSLTHRHLHKGTFPLRSENSGTHTNTHANRYDIIIYLDVIHKIFQVVKSETVKRKLKPGNLTERKIKIPAIDYPPTSSLEINARLYGMHNERTFTGIIWIFEEP